MTCTWFWRYWETSVAYISTWPQRLNDTLGQHIPKEDLTRILKTLEIKIDNITDLGLSLTIPKYRVDVTRSADLIEEVLRIYGYDSIKPSNELKINYPKHDIYDEYYMNEKISEYLVARGYHEIISNSISKSYRSTTYNTYFHYRQHSRIQAYMY